MSNPRLTPERLAELRQHANVRILLGNHHTSEDVALALIDAGQAIFVPLEHADLLALLDAAEERQRLRALLAECRNHVGRQLETSHPDLRNRLDAALKEK